MTSIVAVDESGNLGSEDRYFIIAAIVARRVRDLRPAFNALESVRSKRKNIKQGYEIKFYNSHTDERKKILEAIADCSLKIVFVCIDKDSKAYENVRGKELYREAIGLLLPMVNDALETNDVVLHFDQNQSVSAKDLIDIVRSNLAERNVKDAKKVQSQSNKCIQLADYVAGSIRSEYERHEDCYIRLIDGKISFAYEP